MGISTANISYVKGNVTVSYVELGAVVSYTKLKATVDLNTNVLNKYFTAEQNSPDALTVTISDAPAISLSKGFSDSSGILDSPALSVSKAASDSATLSDALSTVLTYGRSFSETPSVSDSLVGFSFAKALSDAFTMDDTASVSDDLQTDVTLNKNNIVSLSESASISFAAAPSDSATLSELIAVQLTESVGFSRFNEEVINTFMFNE